MDDVQLLSLVPIKEDVEENEDDELGSADGQTDYLRPVTLGDINAAVGLSDDEVAPDVEVPLLSGGFVVASVNSSSDEGSNPMTPTFKSRPVLRVLMRTASISKSRTSRQRR